MKKLLKFNEDAYNNQVHTIQKTLTVLKDASGKLSRHGVKASPKSLMDGNVYGRAFKHYQGKYKNSTFFEEGISFAKYMDLKEVDIEPLKIMDKEIQDQLVIVFGFYPENHQYYSFFEHRPAPEIHAKAGKKISLPIAKLFKWLSEDKIEVTLPRHYFELYATSDLQIQKIEDIDSFISASQRMEIPYDLVKKAVGCWLNHLTHDLANYNINHHELLRLVG
ncbi:hypothetical protein [Flagellimonas myxillae]|uniref:hypothetical protein n=1 Tax=Flagellimonas myxillae TaxID=2942214 RepID=UPI00201F121B|nr:hypothetical protein [Muricauda myxillae]MCL6266572.1 hypothetical protein [Muricauda myxillae]